MGIERKAVSNPEVEFREEIERLIEWAADHKIPIAYGIDKLGLRDAEGTEHRVWYEGNPVRRISFASIDCFNQGPFGQTIQAFVDRDLNEKEVVVIENRKASPSEYLERLYLQNLLFNVNNCLEGLSPFSFETTQPLFVGEGICPEELSEFLGSYGFVEFSALTWFSATLGVAISDVALHNLIRTENLIFPFDIWARRIRL